MIKRTKEVEKRNSFILDIEQKQPKIKVLNIIVFSILFVMACVFTIPLLWLIVSGFKDISEFRMDPPTIIPQSFQPYKLIEVWKKAKFGRTYLNTLIMGIGNVISCVTCSGLAGYVLSRLKPRGHKVIMTLILWTMMMPKTMNMVPLFMTFIDFPIFHFNLSNTFWPFWLMSGATTFYMMLFKSFFDGIPTSYLEAARIDGSSELGNYVRIILPLSKPVIFTVTIFILSGIWGDFLWPFLIFQDPDKFTTGIKIYHLQKTLSVDENFLSMLFVIFPSAVMYFGFQKYLSQGMSLGGVKG